MSIRAYKIKEIKQAKLPTFNIGQEWGWLGDYSCWQAFNNSNELYIVEFDIETIKNGINNEQESGSADNVKILKSILKDMPKGEEYISYMCY